jgi:uncharacterized repeat protein (TIGR01451 family)
VIINGARHEPFTHDAPSDNRDPQWQEHVLAFTAGADSSELCFESTDPPLGSGITGAAMLDNVTVTERSTEPAADLSLTKADSPDPVRVGEALTYTLTATNQGPSTATGMTLTDTLPASVTFRSVESSQGTCTQSGVLVSCALGSLTSGANATVTIVVSPTVAGPLGNTATVTGDQDDPDRGDNTAEQATTVDPVADLALAKSDSPDPVQVGQPLTYMLTVTNNGPSAATGVTLSDTLPTGVEFGSVGPSQGACSESAGTVICALGSLASGATAAVTIVVTPTMAGPLTNTATVGGDPHDPDDANNRATEDTTAEARACPREIRVGETIECSIDAPGEVDEFLFTTAAPIRVLLRAASAAGSSVDPDVQVFSPTGVRVCGATRPTPGLVDHQCALSPGQYVIMVRDRGGDDTGSYHLHLQRLSNPVGASNCSGIDYGQVRPGSVDEPAQTECFALATTEAPTRVLLRLRSSEIDPELRVFAPNGAQVCAVARGAPGLVDHQCVLNAAGPHSIIVDDRGGDETGGFELYAQRPNNPSNCMRIGYGQTLPGSIDEPLETDCFSLTTTAASVNVLLRVSSSEIDPEVRVFGSTGGQLCAITRGDPGLVDHQCLLGAAGTYSIIVDDRGGDETGGFELHLQRVSNPEGAANCTAIDYPQTLPGSIDELLQTACFGLTTTAAGTRVLLRLRSSEIDPGVRVFDPTGGRLCSARRSTPGLVEHQCTLGAAGPHSIIVDDHLGDETGGFELHVQRLNNPAGAPNCRPIGQTQTDSIDEPLETDCFRLTTTAASMPALLRLRSSEIDPELRVFSPTGAQLCATSRSTPGRVELQCTLGAAGPHSIIVDDRGGDETGEYELHLQSSDPCSRRFTPAGWTNGEWSIERLGASIPEAPFEARIDGVSIGTTKLLAFANRLGATDRVPQVLVIASSGYLRLKPGGDPNPPLPFGQSLVLGPAIYSTNTLYFNPQLHRVDIDTTQLDADCHGGLRIRVVANDQGLVSSSTKTNQIMNLTWDVVLPEPTTDETGIDVSGTFSFTEDVTLDLTRTAEFQSFRLYQISSMFIDSSRHDTDAFRYRDSSGPVLISYAPSQIGRLLPANPTPMDPQWPVLDSLHTDDTGIPNGNTPSYRITLGTTTGPIGPPTTPRAFISPSQDFNDDNLGLWVHQWPRLDRTIAAGTAGSIRFEVRATADPLPPF